VTFKPFRFRSFLVPLSKDSPDSFASGSISLDDCAWNEAKTQNLTAELALSDCNRQIHLDFSVYSKADLKSSRAKARKFRKLLNTYLDALDAAFEAYGDSGNV